MNTKLKTCENCRGNGFIGTREADGKWTIKPIDTKTCPDCGGAGYFGSIFSTQETRSTDNHTTKEVDDGRNS